MKKIVFTQAGCNLEYLQPFSLTRRVQDFRIGALTIREKWERGLKLPSFDMNGESKLPGGSEIDIAELKKGSIFLVECNVLPDKKLMTLIKKLKPGEALISENKKIIARYISKDCFSKNSKLKKPQEAISYKSEKPFVVEFFFSLASLNKEALLFDFELLTKNKKFSLINKSNKTEKPQNIFIEKGAVVKHAFLNAAEGPIYISKNALIMEGSCIRGPVFIGEHAVIKMGTKIYGATTIGPGCTVGGEIKNCIFFANSNKAHDGYLGDSVIGEWCNFGAGSSCSNLKNNVGNINFHFADTFFATNSKKCGVIMGDFSRTAINTSINTGTLIGVSAHVFGTGLTPKIISNFSWGFEAQQKLDEPISYLEKSNWPLKKPQKYKLEKVLKDANAWKQLKGQVLTDEEEKMLTELYNSRTL